MTRLLPVVLLAAVSMLIGRAIDQTFAGGPAWSAIELPAAQTVRSGARLVDTPPSARESASPAESSSRTASIRAKWPTPAAMRWQPPRGFLRAAFCVHRHESVDWYRAYVDWRGYPSIYSGGLQFTLSTWRRAGGTGHPHQWRPREQVYRAWRIWRLYRTVWRPGSWTEWGTAGRCGLA